MTKEIILVLGGVASGKSAFAESLFSDVPDRQYIATAQAFDDEMKAKIAAHRDMRGSEWQTHEAPFDLTATLNQLSEKPVLLDCATLWLSNHLLNETPMDALFQELGTAVAAHQAKLVIVSNEVGTAPVATTSLGRQFQNAQGRLNQQIASIADQVYMVTAGLPQKLK